MTVTVDPDLVEAATRAVAAGEAASVSGWVTAALVDKVAKDRRLADLRDAVEAYEAEFGEITSEELTTQARTDRADAVIVRGRRRPASGSPRRAPKTAPR